MSTATDTFQKATCRRCGGVARLTVNGWRHGYPPAGDVGYCPGTGLWPDVPESFAVGQRVTVQGVPDFPAAEGATGTVERVQYRARRANRGDLVTVRLDDPVASDGRSCRRFVFSPDELKGAER